MTADIHAALGQLLAVQRHRVELTVPNLAALGDLVNQHIRGAQFTLVKGKPATKQRPAVPERVVVSYPVTAPCRLAQLHDAVTVGSERAGGRGGGGSRPLIAADALDLWRDVATAAGMWAVAVGVDRATYLRPAEAPRSRTADLAHPPDRVFVTTGTPPVGRLLRATASEADRLGFDAMLDTMARLAVKWAGQIDAVLGQSSDRSIRGVTCPDCDAATVAEDRDGERFHAPALVLSHGWDDRERRPYRWCRACGSWAWLDIDESEAA